MFFTRVAAVLSVIATSLAAPATKRATGFNWGQETIRGVNIGGWLVLEP